MEKKLYLITMHFGELKTELQVYQHYAVATNVELATRSVMYHMQRHGFNTVGWKRVSAVALSRTYIDNLFADKKPKVVTEVQKKKDQKNELMNKILKNKDIQLLQSSTEELTENDIHFLHERLIS
jgi:hypothetical protein